MKILQIISLILFLYAQSYGAVVVLNGLTHVHSMDAGSVITGKIHIRNNSKKESRVIVYKQDLMANCAASITYQDINSHPHSLANWLKTNVDETLLAPNEEYMINYTITIPKEQAQKGTYWTVLMVEGAEPIREEANNGIQVNSKVRYAVQVIADLGAYESPKMTFENVSYKKNDTAVNNIEILIKNMGNYSAKVQLLLEIHDAQGEKIKTFEGLSKRVYPNHCNTYQIEVKDLPKGKYEGVLIADNGKDLFGSNISLEIE